jgi:hypothetical protein
MSKPMRLSAGCSSSAESLKHIGSLELDYRGAIQISAVVDNQPLAAEEIVNGVNDGAEDTDTVDGNEELARY